VADLSSADFQALYERLRGGVRWGADDRRGAVNFITPDRRAAAAREVQAGRAVTLAAPLASSAADNPEPGTRHMKRLPGEPSDVAGVSFAADQLTVNIHGDVDSHIDALCHVSYNGTLYNGVAPGAVTSQGASELSIDDVHDGIVGRGVLLDIPRLRGVEWLEPGDHVTAAELAAAEAAQQVLVGPGDLLFVRVGHRRRRGELGPWDVASSRAGLHPLAMEFLAERQVAVLGSDGNSDAAPSSVGDVAFPVHVLAINALGMYLLDYLQFDDLVPLCEAAGRWSFLCVIAPLRLPGGTGSPVNPIAIL
jgi:kynurenine formamidase